MPWITDPHLNLHMKLTTYNFRQNQLALVGPHYITKWVRICCWFQVTVTCLAKKRRKNTLRSHAVQTGRLAPAACYIRSPWNYTMPHLLHFTVFTALSPGVEPLLLEFTTCCRPRTELLFVRPRTTHWQVWVCPLSRPVRLYTYCQNLKMCTYMACQSRPCTAAVP